MDFRTGLRALRRTPGYALLVVGTLALGIGATTTMFSIVWTVFLRPLPFPAPDRLVTLWESDPGRHETARRLSPANFADWQAEATSFDAVGALPNWSGTPGSFNVAGRDGLERVPGVYASAGFFTAMGIRPQLGRLFADEEDRIRGRRSAVIGHAFWQTRFGGDPAVVGRSLNVDTFRGGGFTIVGVMPPRFDFPRGAQIWLSLADWGGGPVPPPGDANRCCAWYTTIARLKPGVTRERAAAELTMIARRISSAYPGSAPVTSVQVRPLRDTLVGGQKTTLYGLLGAVSCVLLIGCANVANLMLARGVSRRREIATRMALGATRARVARQFLIESLLLGLTGAGLGLLLSLWAQDVAAAAFAARVPLIEGTRLDWTVAAFAIAISLATSIACGLAPLAGTRAAALQARGQGESKHGRRLRHALVVGEIALAVTVVTSAGWLVRTVAKLRAVEVGFDTSRTLVVSADLTTARLRERGSAARFLYDATERISRVPGVRAVAAATGAPFETGIAKQSITRMHDPVRLSAASPQVVHTAVTPGYFGAIGMALVRGRPLRETDAADGPLVAVINETAARRYWPGEDPVGKKFAIGSRERFSSFRQVPEGGVEWREVVGVVSDVRSAGFSADVQPEVFYCYRQFPIYDAAIVVRASGDPRTLVPPVRQAITASGDAVLTGVRTLEDVADQSIADQTLRAGFGMLFSGFALLLGMCGIFGVMSYTVAQRTREIGIRVALGARRREVAAMVIGQALRLSSLGLAAGLFAAFLVSRWISSLFFGVTAADPVILAATCAVLLAAALLATAWPVRRAVGVQPTEALREE